MSVSAEKRGEEIGKETDGREKVRAGERLMKKANWISKEKVNIKEKVRS